MRFKCWSVAAIYKLKRPGQPFHKGAEISAMTIVRRSAYIGLEQKTSKFHVGRVFYVVLIH